jgi:geranylgeranyl pyrophosphate synthase
MTNLAPLAEYRARVQARLDAMPLPFDSLAGTIIAHHLEAHTDLIPSALVVWACAACGGDAGHAVPAATAIELFHRSARLRDEPASIEQWGIGQSLNAGDALNALAYRMLVAGIAEGRRRLDASVIVVNALVATLAGDAAAMMGAGLEAGARLGGAAPERAALFQAAGRLLAQTQLGNAAHAAEAVAIVESCGLDAAFADDFRDAARYVVARPR